MPNKAMDWNGMEDKNFTRAHARASTEDESLNRLKRFQPNYKGSTEDKGLNRGQRFQQRTRASTADKSVNRGQDGVEYNLEGNRRCNSGRVK